MGCKNLHFSASSTSINGDGCKACGHRVSGFRDCLPPAYRVPSSSARPRNNVFDTMFFRTPVASDSTSSGQGPRYPFSPFLLFSVNGGKFPSRARRTSTSYISISPTGSWKPGGDFRARVSRLAFSASSVAFLLGKEVACVRDDLPVLRGTLIRPPLALKRRFGKNYDCCHIAIAHCQRFSTNGPSEWHCWLAFYAKRRVDSRLIAPVPQTRLGRQWQQGHSGNQSDNFEWRILQPSS